MPRLDWDDSMSLGHPEIDRQHKQLVALINRVRPGAGEIGGEEDGEEEVMRAISAMFLYANEHFFDEEALMDRLDYAGAERHKAQHQSFVDKTRDLTDACLAGSVSRDDVADYLVSWLREHIAVEDALIVRLAQTGPATR